RPDHRRGQGPGPGLRQRLAELQDRSRRHPPAHVFGNYGADLVGQGQDHSRRQRVRDRCHTLSAARHSQGRAGAARDGDTLMRRGLFSWFTVAILVVLAIILYLSVFVVSQTQQVLVLRFGNPVRVITEPGLFSKIPLIDNVVYLEKRLIDLDSPPLEVIASDSKRLVVDAFGRYRIVDPLTFYQKLN